MSNRSVPALVPWLALTPATALAHGPNGYPPDPNLHIDTSYEECFVQFAPELTQSAFARFTREFGSVGAFKLMSPPRTLGQWGVAVGLEYIAFTVEEHSDAWNDTFAHPDATHELGSDLGFPKLRARVGILDDLDDARETSPVVELDTEAAFVPHAIAGLEVWHVSVGVEGQLATVPSLQAQVSAVF